MKFLNITYKEGYVVVQMNRGKVNALNLDMVEEIRAVFRMLEHEESVNGVILTGVPNIFSAGLDLIELYDYDHNQMEHFFVSFSEMHRELTRFKKPFIAAINGHSPAGGTVIAVAADYRIMVEGEKFTIGLNEVALNIQISDNLIEAYSFWLGRPKAYQLIMNGQLLKVSEALEYGLVQEVCPPGALLDRAEIKMKQYLSADPDILMNTKSKLRKRWFDHQTVDGTEELIMTNQVWWKPSVRAKMKAYIDYFSNKSKS